MPMESRLKTEIAAQAASILETKLVSQQSILSSKDKFLSLVQKQLEDQRCDL